MMKHNGSDLILAYGCPMNILDTLVAYAAYYMFQLHKLPTDVFKCHIT